MTKKKTNAGAADAQTRVYCGPNIPGVVEHGMAYTGGTLPAALEHEIKTRPALAGLIVTLDELPGAMQQLHTARGRIYDLYRAAQG